MATLQEVQKSASWYHAVTADGLRFAKYHCDANKSIVFAWIESQQMPLNVGSVLSAFQEFESVGSLDGSILTIVPDERALAAQREKKAADAAAEAEKQRMADIAVQNRHFELVEFVSRHRGATTPQALAVEKSIVSKWSLDRLEQAAASIRMRQEWKGKSAAEFKAGVLDPLREKAKPAGIVLPADLDARSIKRMSGAALRLLIKSYVVKGHDEREVHAALNRRLAGQEA